MSKFRSLARASLLSTLALASCNNNSAGVPATAGTRHAIVSYAGVGGGLPSCLTKTCIYAYAGNDKNGKSQITTYANDASGDVAPLGVLSGKHTKLVGIGGAAVGVDHKIYAYVCLHRCTAAVAVYAAGASGDTIPIATITGPDTGLIDGIGSVAVDYNSNVYVASFGLSLCCGAVTVYDAGSNGDVSPIQTITGSDTLIDIPNDITVDASDNIYLSDYHDILVFAAGSNGDVAPIQDISGSNTVCAWDGHSNPSGVAVDSAGKIYTMSGNSICVYRTGSTGNVAPIRVISGDKTKLHLPLNLALDANDNLYVTNYTRYDTGTYITVYPAGAKGNHKPVQTIQGPATLLNGHPPAGIAVR